MSLILRSNTFGNDSINSILYGIQYRENAEVVPHAIQELALAEAPVSVYIRSQHPPLQCGCAVSETKRFVTISVEPPILPRGGPRAKVFWAKHMGFKISRAETHHTLGKA